MEPKDIDDSSVRKFLYIYIYIYKILSGKGKLYQDLTKCKALLMIMLQLQIHQSCQLVAHKKELSSQDGPRKKKAIRNEQMVMTPTMGTSKVRNVHSQTECHDEKGIENGVHGRKRSNVLS